jgi:hypothetical protein
MVVDRATSIADAVEVLLTEKSNLRKLTVDQTNI